MTVNHPHHYGGDTTYEAIKVIEAWDLGFHLGNTVKYVSRAGKKDPSKEIEDLEKARWYLARRIHNLQHGGSVMIDITDSLIYNLQAFYKAHGEHLTRRQERQLNNQLEHLLTDDLTSAETTELLAHCHDIETLPGKALDYLGSDVEPGEELHQDAVDTYAQDIEQQIIGLIQHKIRK